MSEAGKPPNGKEGLGEERRRPAATIDLTATEVENSQAGSPKGEEHAKASPRETSGNGERQPSATDESARDKTRPRSHGAGWPIVGAALAGGSFVAILAGIWLTRSPVRGEPTAALAPRLDAIHSELRSLTKRPPDEMPGLAALANRLDAAEQTLQRIEDVTSRTGTAESSQQQGDLAARTAALEKAVRALHDIAPRLAKLESSASTQARGGETLDARLAAAEAALEQRLGELGRRIDAINDRLADTEQRAVSNERAVDASGAVDRAVRLAVLAAALNAQVERGGPFTLELAAVRPLVADKMQLAPLESVAATGVATAAQLASELASLMPAILSTVAPLSEDDGLLNRLQASAERFVRIRPVTAVAGDDPRSIAARVETKAAQSDIQGALAELAKLPQEGRAPAAEWIKKAEKRVAAIEASRQLAARSVSALVKSAP